MFDDEDELLPSINVSLRGQISDDGVTDVLVLACNDPIHDVETEIALAHEATHLLFPIIVAFMLRESSPEHLIAEVQRVAANIREAEAQ